MFFHKFKSKVVSHLSYMIGSGGKAFVVDPMRDCRIYVDTALREGLNIKYIFETHRNEDYIIGSKELAEMTGAKIYHGVWPEFEYGSPVGDGQEFNVGKLGLTVIHTPGHTPGCISIAVSDKTTGDDTVLVCTGDTLFIGDTGRTDFGGPSLRREWSESLYNSIFSKLLPLGDHVIICPAHGSGSVCGGKIADREMSTLGLERKMNSFLLMTHDEFIKTKLEEHHEYAPYFQMMEKYNVTGAPPVGCGPNPPMLTPSKFKAKLDNGAIIIDTRPPPSYGAGHIAGSYNLYLSRIGMAGWVLPYDKQVIFVIGDQTHLDYVSRSLMRLGYDNQAGYLGGTIVSWYKEGLPIETLDLVNVSELKENLKHDWFVLDVRSKEEYEDGHIEGSLNIYIGNLEKNLDKVPRDKHIAVICKTGTRSSFGASILQRTGFNNLHNVLGGMSTWKKLNYPTV